ncbi:hypothetical protein ACSSS7_003360 [Eimeria intestinalis]
MLGDAFRNNSSSSSSSSRSRSRSSRDSYAGKRAALSITKTAAAATATAAGAAGAAAAAAAAARGVPRVLHGMEALVHAATLPEVDCLLLASSGFKGLRPGLAALHAGKDVALANKEALVSAGVVFLFFPF